MYLKIEEEIDTLQKQICELIRHIEERLEQREHTTLITASLRRSVHQDHTR